MENEEEFQTPDGEEAGNEETPTPEPNTIGTEEQPEAPKSEDVDYKTKFSESTRENQRILENQKKLEQENVSLKESNVKLEAERKELFDAINADNPNAAIINSLRQKVEATERQVADREFERDLKDFVKENPSAGAVADAIRKLAKVENKSPKEIYDANFKPIEERASKAKAEKISQQKADQPETGKGSITKDPSTSALGDDFNKLPLEKRREAFKKMGL